MSVIFQQYFQLPGSSEHIEFVVERKIRPYCYHPPSYYTISSSFPRYIFTRKKYIPYTEYINNKQIPETIRCSSFLINTEISNETSEIMRF